MKDIHQIPFRAEIPNFEYLCSMASRDRERSINEYLNRLIATLRDHKVKTLSQLESALRGK